jgi:hypothetical protein
MMCGSIIRSIALAILFCSIISQGCTAKPIPGKLNKPQQLRWFAAGAKQGLWQDKQGNLQTEKQKLAVNKPISDLYAAAYYPVNELLVTVDKKSLARLYRKNDKQFELVETGIPYDLKYYQDLTMRPVEVYFSEIPGLLYVSWTVRPAHDFAQVVMDHTDRYALGKQARDWHIANMLHRWSASQLQTSTRAYRYHTGVDNTVQVMTPDDSTITLQLSNPLADTWNLMYMQLEPVTIINDKVIFAQTRKGWSMHDITGKSIRFFPTDETGWGQPFFYDGHYYTEKVDIRGRERFYYLFAVQRGELIKVAGNPRVR